MNMNIKMNMKANRNIMNVIRNRKNMDIDIKINKKSMPKKKW
jgi:hypothetical protein